MADETLNKGPEGEKLPESPAPDGPGAPPAPEQAEQVTLPGMGEGGPAPSGKVINLSDVRGDDDKGGKAPAVEAEKPEKRRGRPPKEQAEPKSPKAEKTAKPRAGRPPKGDKAARAEAQPSTRDKVSQSKKKTPEKGSGGMGPPKSPPKGKAGPVKAAAAPVPEINLPPTPAEPPRPVEEGKVVYLKLSELHAFHTFREHPYKVQDDIQTVDQLKAIKTIKGKISDIGKMKVEEQRKAVRAGYDPDILPPDLITFSKDAAELLADLQSRNERMFLLTFTVVNLAPTRQRLENDIFTVGGIAQKYNCTLKRLDWQQEQGFVSSLALGGNEVEIQRGMTTSSTAVFIPFMTRELRMAGPSLYYGMNALSHNVIMADRKKLKSANGLYLGSTGSGKSFAAKRELLNVFLTIPQDRIIIVDPMGEYAPLVRRLGGQVIEIAPDSPNHINPMDIQMGGNDEDSPLSMKADFLLSLCELVVGGKEGLQPIEKTVIDRCVRLVYRDLALGVGDGRMPLLQDLYEELLKQPEPEARRVATALELYCTGSLNLFNHPTNVKTDCRVVCIVLKGMGDNLRKIAMHVTNEFVNSSVNTNYQSGISTWCYFDEFHVLLRDQLTASYFVSIWQMLRKRGCVPSALTQNVKHLLASPEIQNILDNTDFMILLSQAQSDRAILAKQLGISEHQLSYITHSNSGEGLLFYGNVTIPFMDRFPRGEIYDLLTTRPEDLKDGAAG